MRSLFSNRLVNRDFPPVPFFAEDAAAHMLPAEDALGLELLKATASRREVSRIFMSILYPISCVFSIQNYDTVSQNEKMIHNSILASVCSCISNPSAVKYPGKNPGAGGIP